MTNREKIELYRRIEWLEKQVKRLVKKKARKK